MWFPTIVTAVGRVVQENFAWEALDQPCEFCRRLLDAGVLFAKQLKERRQQCFASLSDVVHTREDTQIAREFFL